MSAFELPIHPDRLWRSPELKSSYDVIVIGAGGHGLATAHWLAAELGVTDVLVAERGWLGGGNVARNTAIVRSNYLWPESAALYEHALQLWEGLQERLDYDLMFSQRGLLSLAHSEHEVRDTRMRVFANQASGIDAEWLEPDEIAALCPLIDTSAALRYPVHGAGYQPRAGIAKHDHVAWAYARAADELGVDIVQGCEVRQLLVEDGAVRGVETSLGRVTAPKVALAAAGRTTLLTDALGIRLPLQSRPLQALVSELLEPVLPCVVMSNAIHVYVSQAHKGELVMGAGLDGYASFAREGSPHVIERQLAGALELLPAFAGAHVLRTWAGVVDVTPDACPIIDRLDVEGLYVNCGWGSGGFKATPAAGELLARLIVDDEAPPLARPFSAQRFVTGALIDEHGAAGVAH